MISWLKSLKYMVSIKKALALFNSYMTNRTQQVQIVKGRSFIYKINNNGPSIEP
jgi:hypothetical protein